MSDFPRTLRTATFMCPDFPIELFEGILHYLEDQLHIYTTLQYESRWKGPHPDRPDPFASDTIDLAWVNSISYFRLTKTSPYAKLLPVSTVHHVLPVTKKKTRAGHLLNLILHKDSKPGIEYFYQMRGFKWAFSSYDSFSAHQYTLYKLRQMGENANFFSSISMAGSENKTIQMVHDKIADAAVVDANCLAFYFEEHPTAKEELHILETWGPLSPYPIVINSRLPDTLQENLVQCLLNMHTNPEGAKILKKFGIQQFDSITPADFSEELEIIENTKKLSFEAVYY